MQNSYEFNKSISFFVKLQSGGGHKRSKSENSLSSCFGGNAQNDDDSKLESGNAPKYKSKKEREKAKKEKRRNKKMNKNSTKADQEGKDSAQAAPDEERPQGRTFCCAPSLFCSWIWITLVPF